MRRSMQTVVTVAFVAGLLALAWPAVAQHGSTAHQALTPEQKAQQAFSMLDSKMFVELESDKTNGALAMLRVYVPPKSGPPPHVHTREDEIFTILKGHYRFRHGSEEIDAPAGTTLFLPRGVPHVFRNIGDEPGEHILVLIPGGLEKMFREISAAQLQVPRDIAKINEVFAKYGITNLPPPSFPLSTAR